MGRTPVTIKLPDGLGYAAITEANLGGFAGMALQADGDLGFAARLGHAHPASYPFTLRYKDDVERLARPASLKGAITSPWRVVMVGADLNTLVNCDIVQSVSPPPDPVLFPKGLDTAWVKPGRAVWKFLDGGENSLAGMKEFSRLAGDLGFEYNVIEGFWQRWTDAQLRELVDDSKAHGVGIWLWKHSKDLRNPKPARRSSESARMPARSGLRSISSTTRRKKWSTYIRCCFARRPFTNSWWTSTGPTSPPANRAPGQTSWREGVYGLEHKGMTQWAANNTTLPFTRFLPDLATTRRSTSATAAARLRGRTRLPGRDHDVPVARLRRPPPDHPVKPRG